MHGNFVLRILLQDICFPHLNFFGAARNGPGGISQICRCILIAHLLCARQVEVYLNNEYIEEYYISVVALFSRFKAILIV